jgi:4-hydroxyphenylpyruvate dioxygenase
MNIDHVHFYIEDARAWSNWFVKTMGLESIGQRTSLHTHSEILQVGNTAIVLSSPLALSSPVANFLRSHAPGVADLAFCVSNLEQIFQQAVQAGAKVLQPIQQQQHAQGRLRWGTISAWGSVCHTLVERSGMTSLLPEGEDDQTANLIARCNHSSPTCTDTLAVDGIDHVVLNVAADAFESAIAWYRNVLGFEPKQSFTIQTEHSGLLSQVMTHPLNGIQLPINAPTSASSQIQEFLNLNGGSGIQHIALKTSNIVQAIQYLRQRGLLLLQVPQNYYKHLGERLNTALTVAELQMIQEQEILVDWDDERQPALLLQTFTQPIFEIPTFFFELIERRSCLRDGQWQTVEGFGERNFYALFAAIEQEQRQRGTV